MIQKYLGCIITIAKVKVSKKSIHTNIFLSARIDSFSIVAFNDIR